MARIAPIIGHCQLTACLTLGASPSRSSMMPEDAMNPLDDGVAKV
mgnify:CR=1 FL=1